MNRLVTLADGTQVYVEVDQVTEQSARSSDVKLAVERAQSLQAPEIRRQFEAMAKVKRR